MSRIAEVVAGVGHQGMRFFSVVVHGHIVSIGSSSPIASGCWRVFVVCLTWKETSKRPSRESIEGTNPMPDGDLP